MTRLNEAEWLIEPFYESQTRGFQWTFGAEAGVRSKFALDWQAVAISWEDALAGAVVARLERAFDLDLADADRLGLCLSHAADQQVSLHAVIDGTRQTVVENAPGANCFAEYEGPVQGSRLESIVIEISTETSGDGCANLLWLIAVSSQARERYRRQRYASAPELAIFLRDSDVTLRPHLNLLLPDGVEGLRRRVAAPQYRHAWNQVRRQAESFMNTEPEWGVCEHLARPAAGGDRGAGSGRYEHDLGSVPKENQAISITAMQSCALVGLADNDARFARLALRHALAAAHCTHWDDSFMMTHPGALWDHRAFTAMGITKAFVSAIDWAGALLSDAGVDFVGRAISMKVLPKIDFSLRKYAYMRGNNQAIFFASTGILAVCTLGRLMDRGGDGLGWYVDVLKETVENYFLADGGTYEGAAYHDDSTSLALLGFAVAARYWNTPVEELLPSALLRAGNYYRVMASTAETGCCINTSDGGRVGRRCAGGAVPLLARLTRNEALLSLTAALCEPDGNDTVPGAIALLAHGANELPDPVIAPPTFEILAATGVLCSCRPTSRGPIRIQLIGAKANAGHGHEDKGSFVLEAFGEELLIDRGTCFYGDARSELLKHAWRHNMMTPDDADGRPMHQVNPLPEAVIPHGSGDETEMRAHTELTAGWPETLAHAIRAVESTEPTTSTLTDTVQRRETGTVSLHFQSRFPWVANDAAWSSRGKRAVVTIQPYWDVARSDAVEDLFDSSYAPVYRLTLQTRPGLAFMLRTDVGVKAVPNSERNG